MIKTFFKDSLIYTIPTFFSRGIAIFLLPLYTSITTPEGLGALDLFLVFGNIIALTIALEITQGVARYIPDTNEKKLNILLASTGLFFTLIMYLIFLFTSLIFHEKINFFITGDKKYVETFQLAIIYIFFNGIFYYLQNLLRFKGRSSQFSIISVLYAFLNLLLTFIFGVIFSYGLEGIFYSLIFSTVISSLLGTYFLRDALVFSINFKLLKKLLSFSLPLVPSSVLVFLSLYVDRYMLNNFIGIEEVGLYSVGARIASAAGLIMIGFQMSISPLIYKNYKNYETPNDLSYIFRIFVVIALFFFMIFSFLSKELILILTSSEYLDVVNIIPILTLTFLFSNMYVFMPGITIRKKTKIILFINLLVAIINVGLNFILIPRYGIMGASAATLFGYFCGFLMYIFFSQKLYYVKHYWFKYSLNFILSISLVFYYYANVSIDNNLLLIIVRLIFVVLLLIMIFLSKLITREDINNLKIFLYKDR